MTARTISFKVPPAGITPTIINVSGTLNAGNSFQYSASMGLAAAPGSETLCILECIAFSMTNYMGIETQAVTVGAHFDVSKTYLNEWWAGATVGTSGGVGEYNPLIQNFSGGMRAYDGVTDYAGTSGTTLTTTYTFNPQGGNSGFIYAVDAPNAQLTVIAFMEENERAPVDGTLLTLGWTTFAGQFSYYYI